METGFIHSVVFWCVTEYPGGSDDYSSARQAQPQQPRRTPATGGVSGATSGATSAGEERSAERSSATAAGTGAAGAAVANDGFGDIDAILGGSFEAGVGAQGQEDSTSSGSISSGGGDVGGSGLSSGENSAGGASGSGGADADAAREEIEGLKVPELKERCKALGLKVGGKKAELQARILEALEQ